MQNKIEDLRNHLFATLESLRDEDQPMDVNRAKAVAEVSGKIIDTAKVEIQFVEAFGGELGTDFIPRQDRQLPPGQRPNLVSGGKG